LGRKVFQWNAATGTVDELKDFEELEANPTVSKWSKEGQYIAVGFSDGTLKVYSKKYFGQKIFFNFY
jgi:WD40 repeat protein